MPHQVSNRATAVFNRACATVAAAGTAVLGVAGPAHADDAHTDTVGSANPQGYVRALISHGIDPRPVSEAIDAGYLACNALWKGIPAVTLIDDVATQGHLARNLVAWVVIDASVYLCPQAPFDGESQVGPPAPDLPPPPPADTSPVSSAGRR